MSVRLFVEKENGDLKSIAEVEGVERPDLALDALLDENPRLKHTEYVAITGDSLEDAQVCTLVVEDDQPVNPRRGIRVSREEDEEEARPKRGGRKAPAKPKASPEPEEEDDEEDEEEEAPKPKPAPKRTGGAKGGRSKSKATKAPPKKAPVKKTPRPKGGGNKGGKGKKSPFTRNPGSDE